MKRHSPISSFIGRPCEAGKVQNVEVLIRYYENSREGMLRNFVIHDSGKGDASSDDCGKGIDDCLFNN